MEPDFGSWQLPDISRSHLYRGTIAWTPPTAIYRAYTVVGLIHEWFRLQLVDFRPWTCNMASDMWVSVDTGNVVEPNRWQAITWTNADILSYCQCGPFEQISVRFFIEMHDFSFNKWFENVICKISAILFRPECFNSLVPRLQIFLQMITWKLFSWTETLPYGISIKFWVFS